MMSCFQNQSSLKSPVAHLPCLLGSPFRTLQSTAFLRIPTTLIRNSSHNRGVPIKSTSFLETSTAHLLKFLKKQVFSLKEGRSVALLLAASFSAFPSLAAGTEQVPEKINLESVVIAIDDFFNRYPFFVAGVTFVWLVVIPLAEEFVKKYKYLSAYDAFRKLQGVPNCQLLDIRRKQSLKYLNSPSLKILNKNVVQVEFSGVEKGVFVNEVLENFQDPGSTIICVIDNFDGDSLAVAELLTKNGFKEAYAIKGGLRGKDGWQAIQETLLPPSMHVNPRKKKNKSSGMDEVDKVEAGKGNGPNGQLLTSASVIINKDSER